MKILFDYCTFSAQKFGGISRYYVELTRNLAGLLEIEPRIAAPLHINAYLPTLPASLRTGICVPEIRRTGIIRDTINRSVMPWIEGSFRPHVVHETFYRKPWSRHTRAKTCVTVYDMIQDKFGEMIPASEQDLFKKNLQVKRDTIKRADLVFCISKQTKMDLMELYGVSESKIRVTHLSASLPPILQAQKNIGKPYLLFVGSRGWYKNFSVVLRAFGASQALAKDFDLICFGGGPFSSEEFAEIQKLNLESSVRQTGGSDDDLARYYRGARAFIFPSQYEGFGIPLLESMWADCPLIASRASCFPEIAGDAAAYFDANSIEDCEQIVRDVLYQDQRRQELIKNGRERRAQFSWQKTALETAVGYRDLL